VPTSRRRKPATKVIDTSHLPIIPPRGPRCDPIDALCDRSIRLVMAAAQRLRLGRIRIFWGHQNQGPSSRASGITKKRRTIIMSNINPIQIVEPA